MPDLSAIVCRHGLLLVQGDVEQKLSKSLFAKKGKLTADERGAAELWAQDKLILVGAPQDSLLLDESGEKIAMPPISVNLSPGLIDGLRAERQNAVAATHVGPRDPDKPCNQDFALALEIAVSKNDHYAIGIVADGVSTKVFWPERASRIAGLVALEQTFQFLEALSRGAQQPSLPERLKAALVAAYERDKLALGDTPSLLFDPDFYAKRKDQLESWYQSTLLVGVLGRNGFVLCAGDGAVVELQGESMRQQMETTDDLSITSCASLTMGAHDCGTLFDYDEGQRVLILTSDGVDRTAATAPGFTREDYFKSLNKRISNASQRKTAAFLALSELASTPGAVRDNYSVAWLRTPDKGGDVLTQHALLEAPPPPPPPPPASPPPPSGHQHQPATGDIYAAANAARAAKTIQVQSGDEMPVRNNKLMVAGAFAAVAVGAFVAGVLAGPKITALVASPAPSASGEATPPNDNRPPPAPAQETSPAQNGGEEPLSPAGAREDADQQGGEAATQEDETQSEPANAAPGQTPPHVDSRSQ